MASEKVTKLIDDVKTLTVLELSELVKALEKNLVYQQQHQVAIAAAPAAGWSSRLKKNKQNLM